MFHDAIQPPATSKGLRAIKSKSQNDVQVAVVGFGPSGAMAANLLGQAGVNTYCIDQSVEVYDKPRAIALDHEILRIMDNIGIADVIAPYIAPFDLSEHFGAEGQLLRRIGMVGAPYPLGYTPTMVFTQPPVEEALRQRANVWPSVKVELGVELIDISQSEVAVTLHVRHADGSERRVTADYVIACDGASSGIRRRLGIALDDLAFDEPWVVVDVKVNDDKLDRVPANSAHYCDPLRPIAYVVGPGLHRRWEIMLSEADDPREMEKPENVWRLLKPWIGPEDATLWRSASYRFHALVARDWRRGRVFLAGDAAHQQPPILGQGMCQGIRDVANLSWKLADVLAHRANEDILDTYGQERSAHVRELIYRIKEIGEVLCERDPEEARARDTRVLAESGGVPTTITRQSIIPSLRHGFLVSESGAGVGTLFPQPLVRCAGRSGLLDAICGGGWRLVIDARVIRALPRNLMNATRELGIRVLKLDPSYSGAVSLDGSLAFTEADSILADWFNLNGRHAAIVRPDHYVFALADDVPSISASIKFLYRRSAVELNPMVDAPV